MHRTFALQIGRGSCGRHSALHSQRSKSCAVGRQARPMNTPLSSHPHPAQRRDKTPDALLVAVAALCIALNVGLGSVIYLTKLPIYLDAVGTIALALLAGGRGWRGFGISGLVGAASFALVGLLNPVVFWFIPTQLAIAAYSFYVARPLLRTTRTPSGGATIQALRVVPLGLGLGVVTAVVSAPIIAGVFGGMTGAGASFVTALLLKSGQALYRSVLTSGLATEPLDKLLQLTAALAIVRATPSRIRNLLSTPAS